MATARKKDPKKGEKTLTNEHEAEKLLDVLYQQGSFGNQKLYLVKVTCM